MIVGLVGSDRSRSLAGSWARFVTDRTLLLSGVGDHVQSHAPGPVSRREINRLSMMLALPQLRTDSRRDDCTDTLCITIKYTVK